MLMRRMWVMSTIATRTLNPLHFEDLEPHRFEDLVRQLAYQFRAWRTIEATGRVGADEGVDIRAVEMVTILYLLKCIGPKGLEREKTQKTSW